ncbi:hypothetical protein DUNSADRAFT_2328, partial [Dunaliella salina]
MQPSKLELSSLDAHSLFDGLRPSALPQHNSKREDLLLPPALPLIFNNNLPLGQSIPPSSSIASAAGPAPTPVGASPLHHRTPPPSGLPPKAPSPGNHLQHNQQSHHHPDHQYQQQQQGLEASIAAAAAALQNAHPFLQAFNPGSFPGAPACPGFPSSNSQEHQTLQEDSKQHLQLPPFNPSLFAPQPQQQQQQQQPSNPSVHSVPPPLPFLGMHIPPVTLAPPASLPQSLPSSSFAVPAVGPQVGSLPAVTGGSHFPASWSGPGGMGMLPGLPSNFNMPPLGSSPNSS